jgi:hypothetical protein
MLTVLSGDTFTDMSDAAPVTVPQFTKDALMNAVVEETGLSDFGSDPFVEGLEVLITATTTEGHLSELGRMAKTADVLRLLRNRLRFEHDVKLHPEILDEPILPPIIILGLVRTGTSKLQGVLSTDPGAQRLELWRMYNSAPFPGASSDGPDPRIAEAQLITQMLHAQAPEFFALHPMEAAAVNEEAVLMDMTFQCPALAMWAPVPSYRRWLDAQPPEPAYQYLRRLLQYLQWQDGGAQGRHFVMKSPAHLGSVRALLRVFPDAVIVHCHRDPSEIIASFSRLILSMRSMMCEEVEPISLGAEMLDIWSSAMQRNVAQRSDPAVAARIVDFHYRQVVQEPIEVARIVYECLGKELSVDAVSAMNGWEDSNPQYKYGRVEYSLEQFGLDQGTVDAAFNSYLDQVAQQSLLAEPLTKRRF